MTDSLAHEIRNSIAGIKLALRRCDDECPKAFHNVTVRQKIVHNVNRMERALKVYVSSKRFKSS